MNLKLTNCIAAFWILTSLSHATIQHPDYLTTEEEYYEVYGFRLSSSLREQIDELWRLQANRIVSSGNWDGFYADLEIRGNRLYLTSLDIDWFREEEGTGKLEIELMSAGGVFCDWFTGELRVPDFSEDSEYVEAVSFHFRDGVLLSDASKRKLEFESLYGCTPLPFKLEEGFEKLLIDRTGYEPEISVSRITMFSSGSRVGCWLSVSAVLFHEDQRMYDHRGFLALRGKNETSWSEVELYTFPSYLGRHLQGEVYSKGLDNVIAELGQPVTEETILEDLIEPEED